MNEAWAVLRAWVGRSSIDLHKQRRRRMLEPLSHTCQAENHCEHSRRRDPSLRSRVPVSKFCPFARGTVSKNFRKVPIHDTENSPGGGSHPTSYNDADIDRRGTRGMNSAPRGNRSRVSLCICWQSAWATLSIDGTSGHALIRT